MSLRFFSVTINLLYVFYYILFVTFVNVIFCWFSYQGKLYCIYINHI